MPSVPWITGDGEMAHRIRAHDWSATPLGPLADWPPSLRTTVGLLLACGHAMSLAWGPERTFLYNDAYAPMLGQRHPRALGVPFHEAWPDVWPAIAPLVERVFEGETVRFEDYPLVMTRNGYREETWWNFSYSPVLDAHGAVAGLLNVTVDATAARHAEAALRTSEAQFRALATTGVHLLYRMSPDWRVMQLLNGAETLGATAEPIEDWVERYLLPQDRDAILAAIEEAVASRSLFQLEHRMRLAGGGTGWVLSRAVPVLAPDGQVLEWVGVGIDTTARRQAEHVLRVHEERNAFLLELSDALGPLVDPAAIQATAQRLLGTHLQVDRVHYAEADPDADPAGDASHQPRDPARPPVPAFLPASAGPEAGPHDRRSHGEPWVVSDAMADARFSAAERAAWHAARVRAAIVAPLVKDGRLVAELGVQCETPREWTASERALVEEVAERTWAAVARARSEASLRQNQRWLAAQKEAFRRAMDGQPLAASLGILADSAVELVGQCRCAFYLVDATGRHLRHVTGMPESHARHVQGVEVSPDSLACGLAVAQGRPVITPDVHQEPRMQSWAWLAREHGYRGCWSFPIETSSGLLVGSMTLYTDQVRVPTARERELFATFTGTAAILISRHQGEALLRQSEERLRQFGEASSDVLWIRDAETLQWEYLTPAFEAIYGLDRASALREDNLHNWLALIVEEDRARALACLEQVRAGERVTFEYRVRRPADGGLRWLRNTDFPIRDEGGRVRHVGGIGHDITAMKTAEHALAEAERRQRLLLEGIPQLVWRALPTGDCTWASPQWVAHTGLGAEASHGKGWLQALHPHDRDRAVAAWQEAQRSGRYGIELRIWSAAKSGYGWFQASGVPFGPTGAGIVEWLGTCTDIDEQVRARELLAQAGEEMERRVAARTAELQQALETLHRETQQHEQAEERLHQSEKLKAVGQLTGGIAHDFNNMLQGITTALALVRARLAQGRAADAAAYLEPASRAAARAGALTHRLLAFSRQQTLTPRLVSMDQVAQGMEDMIRRTVGPAVQVELKLGDGHWLVLCDPNQLESALLNLCINARDAMPQGGWLTIGTDERTLAAEDLAGFEDLVPGRYVTLSVTDTGTGMPPEVRARVFEPFFTTKPPGQGTGLGLSQIYGFMRQSGGLVQIETALYHGTTMRLCLPCVALNDQQEAGATFNGRTLLLVEDEHDLRAMLADQLRELGYRVLEAESPAAAERVLNTGAVVDLLVTDLGLPGAVNGRQFADAARKRMPGLPVIFITGFAGEEPLQGEDVLQKPFEIGALSELVAQRLPAP